jgi:hypothetical protein
MMNFSLSAAVDRDPDRGRRRAHEVRGAPVFDAGNRRTPVLAFQSTQSNFEESSFRYRTIHHHAANRASCVAALWIAGILAPFPMRRMG